MYGDTITRAYLKDLPEEHRKELINTFIVKPNIVYLKRTAIQGKTSYVYYENNHNDHCQLRELGPITKEELINGFRKVFPDCTISYEIVVVETTPGLKISQGAIIIDWS